MKACFILFNLWQVSLYFSPKPLEGTWNFPQVPDSISLGSSTGEEETDTGDLDSVLSSSLPDADLALFDPLCGDNNVKTDDNVDGDGDGDALGEVGMIRSNAWLMEALSTCANMNKPISTQNEANAVDFSVISNSLGSSHEFELALDQNFSPADHNVRLDAHSRNVEVRKDSSGSLVEIGIGDENFMPLDFGGLGDFTESKVSCGRGDLDLSNHGSLRSQSVSSASSALSTPSTSGK